MTNVSTGNFKQYHLQDLAIGIIDVIEKHGEERGLSLPEALGVLRLVEVNLIDQAIEQELDED